ncbi:Kinetochore-associated protein 1 [Clydaea vesicula]|uniref:Kinetochore-associated protein 1 n=1 Tax=Clydaea vesicula TaxID=447962 RepID=A0AAD5Y0F6_9FUNG|nr:Kinetochore-associated protein 1 [Clydaea vesicula]
MFKFIKSDVSIDLRETKGSEVYKLESHSKLFKIIDNHDIPLNLSLNSNNEFLTIKTNNQLHILNASENSLHTTINLDCEPELSSFNKNNSFLVVGDRKGTLHFIHVKTKNFILSKDMHIDKCQDENENFFKKLKFVKAESKVKKSEELIVALNNFTLVRFSNIDFSRIETALNSGNFDEALSAKQAICTEIVQMTNFTKINDLEHNCAVDFSESSVLDRTYIAGSGREPLQIYKTDNKTFKTSKVTCVSRALKGKEIKKIRIRENLMILLTSNREISIWDPVRLFFLKRINFKSVKDFCFYEEKLLVLTKTLDGNVCNLKLLSLMDSAENFSTVVGNFNGGITCVNSTADENCWLDDGANNNGVWFLETQYANSGISIAVQFLCESKPFVKFQNLVQAKKYEDAKRIALEFGLDTQIVEEARLNEVLKNEKSHHDDEYLINLLKEIKNISFSINFCLSIQCDSQNSTYRFLEYALNTVKTTGLEYSDLRTVVVKTIKKFGTFILLHCNKTMNELVLKDENFDANEWQKFRSLDLLELLKDFFRLGKLSEGILVWRRHNLDENLIDFIDEILEALSNEVAPYLYLNWLKTEVFPFLNDIESRTKIAIWVEKRARMVERLEQNPSNALKICKLLILEESVPKYKPKTPLKFVERTFINHEYQEDEEDDNGVKGTKKTLLNQNLIEELENLCYLREKHDFQLSLIDYTQSTPASIAFELLDRVVNFEFLKEEIERHFKPYAKKMNLNPEELLCEYCMEVMENVVTDSIPLVVEDRILAVIDCVQGNDSKIEIVLEFLGRCSIPWSSNVQNLIDKAFEWVSEKKKEDLAEHYRLIKVKGMLMKYGLNFFNIQDYSFTKSMILVQSLTTACFLGLLGYITNRLDVVDAIEDAILIVSVYLHVDKFDAYTMRLKKLAYNGEVHRILNLLKNLTEEGTKFQFDSKLALEVEGGLTKTDALTLGQKLLCWIVEIIDHQVDKFAKLKNISGDDENENFNFEILVKNNTLDFSKEKLKHLNLLKVAKEVCAFLLRLQDDGMNSDYQADLNIQSIPFYSENHNFIIGSAVCSLEKDCGNNVKSKPQAVALDFNSTFITNESLKNLSNLINLMLEFNILFGWSKYQDIKLRRILLRKFAKTVFTTNSEETNIGKVPVRSSKVASDKSQSALYRLAELLGYERSSLKGILAEEAASCGDFQIALFICKELFENFPNEETSKVLKTVSKLLVQFSSFHKNIFSDLKDDFKFTSRMLLLSQQALLTCSVDSLSDSLDTFKNLELQHSIFTQCEAGNYKMLIEKSSKKTGFNQNAIATSSKFAFTPSEPNPEDEVTNFKDKYASNLFEEHYKANGLVLNTATAMSLTNDFIMDIINSNMEMKSENSLFEVPLTYLLNSNFRSSGKKNKAISVDPVQQGKILVDYLKKNRNLFAALRSLNRSIEARWRWQFDDVFISERDTVAKENVEIIQHTLNNVLSSRYIDQKLALGLMFALPTAKAFESIKHSLGITGIDYALTIKVANIGTTAAVVWGQRQFQVQCMALAMQSKWYYQFRLLGIPFDERAFQSSGVSGDYQRTLVSIFLEKSSMDVLAALEFARNYNIEDDFVLFEYLKMLLLSPNDYGGYQSKIIGLVDDIVNQSKLLAVLEELYLNRISPYDYERIKFVIKLILKIDPEQEVPKRKLAILEIIWNYRRQFPPMLDELVDAKERRKN